VFRPRTDRERRERFFQDAASFTPLVGVESDDDLLFVVPTWDQRVGRKLFVATRRKEMKQLRRALELLAGHGFAPRGTFLDVGANIGTTTLPALALGFDRAVAIEPSPENVRLLRANATLNGLEGRLTVIEAAAADRAGRGALRVHAKNSGGHRLHDDGIPVDLVRLADVGSGASMIWMDIQGAEHSALAGAGDLVGTVPIVVELSRGKPRETAALLAAYRHAYDLADAARVTGVGDAKGHVDLLLVP
jgi:FkbM family methyltransferase